MKFDADKGDYGWLYDADGFLCRPAPISGDTETGECLCQVFDQGGIVVVDHELGETVKMVRHFKPPLTIVPITPGCNPPEHQFTRRADPSPDAVVEDQS